MNTEERNNLIKAYGDGYAVLKEVLKNIPRKIWQSRLPETTWSIHETIIHIANSEIIGYLELLTLLTEPGKTIAVYDQNNWSEKLGYNGQSVEDALELFQLLRVQNFRRLVSLPESAWNNSVKLPGGKTLTVEDWLARYTRHIPDHIRRIRKIYETWKNR